MLAAEDYMIILADTPNPSVGVMCRFGLFPTSIYLKPAEEIFNAVKDVDELVLASARIFSHLDSVSGRTREGCRTLTERRMPIPAKITPAGGNAWK
jgi:hypothetical protein